VIAAARSAPAPAAPERWLQRFVDTGLKICPDEVIAQGPPWETTLCVRGTVHLDTEDGRVYENRYVIWGRMAWGCSASMRFTRIPRRARRSTSTSRDGRAPG
jgi:hypothetical protein